MNRTPILIVISASVMLVGILFVVAMQAGVLTMVLLVVCVGALCWLALIAFRGFTATRLTWQTERNRHDEAVIKMGHMPDTYLPIPRQAQLAAPVPQIDARYTDPRRAVALRLLNATLDSDKYGPRSAKIMTQADAAQVGIIADDWSSGVGYLCAFFHVATGNKGTLITNEKTASRIMADVASVARDVTDSAVAALPEVRR